MNQDFLDCPCENNCLEGCENCSNSVCECKDKRFNKFLVLNHLCHIIWSIWHETYDITFTV